MNDNDIIKALECCAKNEGCAECPYISLIKTGGEDCISFMAKQAIDLINRQRAEIERLQAGEYRYIGKTVQNARTEAIEDFAEKLKEKSDYCYMGNIDALVYRITAKDLESIVKEILDGEHG